MSGLCLVGLAALWPVAQESSAVPHQLRPWLDTKQTWERDTAGPILSLGSPGRFDDTHIFAPAVSYEAGRWSLWYCGSTGRVAERVFRLGLAQSPNGRSFERVSPEPVFGFGDGARSVLTPTLLRGADGSTLREAGRLRMWFSATSFADGSGRHTLHEATSVDGVNWSAPSPVLLEGVYAPTVLRSEDAYLMWFVDVSTDAWCIRHARSTDGRLWRVEKQACLQIDQSWERQRLFYPTVLRQGEVYLMWYGSYWSQRASTTALGFAASVDGRVWHKHPSNPVFTPDPNRDWESHYVTSQSLMRMPEGGLRMWYASRRRPPFVNKYFAISTAILPTFPVGDSNP